MTTAEQKKARQDFVRGQIVNELMAMSHKYDAKELAIIMFWQACKIFRAVHSLGIWPVKEVESFTTAAMNDVLIPLPSDQLPRQAIIDENGVLNPGTSQTVN